jgi:hypothetical protein
VAGQEFEPGLVRSFMSMMQQWEPSVAVVADEPAAVAVLAPAEPRAGS